MRSSNCRQSGCRMGSQPKCWIKMLASIKSDVLAGMFANVMAIQNAELVVLGNSPENLGIAGTAKDSRGSAYGRQSFFVRYLALRDGLLHGDANFGVFLQRQRLSRFEYAILIGRIDRQVHGIPLEQRRDQTCDRS